MCDTRSRLTPRAFGDHAQRPWSHRVLPALRQRSRASMNQGDASSGQPKYDIRPLACTTNNKRFKAKVRGRRGRDSRISNFSWDSSYLSDSDSTIGITSNISIDPEQSPSRVRAEAWHDAEMEDEMYHAVDNHGLDFTSSMLGTNCLSCVQPFRHDLGSRTPRKAVKRTSPTSVVSDPVSTKRCAWRGWHDSALGLKASDRSAASRFEPRRPGEYGLDLLLRSEPKPLTISGRRYNRSENAAEWRLRSKNLCFHEPQGSPIAGSVRISFAEYLSLQRLSEASESAALPQAPSSSRTIDLAGDMPSDREAQEAPVQRDSAMSGERYVGVAPISYYKSEVNNNIEPVQDSECEDPSARKVKRHATEISRDAVEQATSRKSSRCNIREHRRIPSQEGSTLAIDGSGPQVHTGRDVEADFAAQHDSLLRIPEFEIPRSILTGRHASSIKKPTPSEHHSPLHSGTEPQRITLSSVPHDSSQNVVIERRASPSDFQVWLSEQLEECTKVDQHDPIDPPSTLYQPDSLQMSEMDSHTSAESEALCCGIMSMRTYLAAKGSNHACSTATWEDAEDMLEELKRFDFPAFARGSLYLKQLTELVPEAAKEAQQEISPSAVDAWLVACQIDDDETLENDALLEIISILCLGLCDLGLTVFQLACFVASLVRSLATTSFDLWLRRVSGRSGPASASSWSSSSGNGQYVYAGQDNPKNSSSKPFGFGATNNTGTGGEGSSGRRKFSERQDGGDEDFEANRPGAEGNDDDEPTRKVNLEMPCVDEKCPSTHPYISYIIRCLEKAGLFVCGQCWIAFPNRTSYEDHEFQQEIQGQQGTGASQASAKSACVKYCVAPCGQHSGSESLLSAESIKNQRHQLVRGCKKRSAEARLAQWRYLYALKYPECERVPDLVMKSKRFKPMAQILSSAFNDNTDSSRNDGTAYLTLQAAYKELQTERPHLIHLLKMSSALLANNDSEPSMTLRKCISEKLSEHAASAHATSSNSGNNDTAFASAPAMPLTPDSNVRHNQAMSVNARPPTSGVVDDYQSMTASTPTTRSIQPQFPVAEGPSFTQMQDPMQATAYQHHMAGANHGPQFAMQTPQPQQAPQSVNTWQTQYAHSTSCDTPQFSNTNQQLATYDFDPQQRMQMQFSNVEDAFLFAEYNGEFQGNQQQFQ